LQQKKSDETERETPKNQKTRKIIYSREKALRKFGREGQISNAV